LKIIWNFYGDRCFILKLVYRILFCCYQMIDVGSTKIKENNFKTELIFVFTCFVESISIKSVSRCKNDENLSYTYYLKKSRRIKLSMFLRDINSYWLESICIWLQNQTLWLPYCFNVESDVLRYTYKNLYHVILHGLNKCKIDICTVSNYSSFIKFEFP